MKVRY